MGIFSPKTPLLIKGMIILPSSYLCAFHPALVASNSFVVAQLKMFGLRSFSSSDYTLLTLAGIMGMTFAVHYLVAAFSSPRNHLLASTLNNFVFAGLILYFLKGAIPEGFLLLGYNDLFFGFWFLLSYIFGGGNSKKSKIN